MTNISIVGGSNWCSLTHSFVEYIISKEKWIEKHFSYTFCADEIFIHTLAFNSLFRNKIFLLKINEKNNDFDPDMYKANMRLIDWNRGKPYTFQNEDFEQLKIVRICLHGNSACHKRMRFLCIYWTIIKKYKILYLESK